MATTTQPIENPVVPFTFEEETHTYRDLRTKLPILSVTQVLDSVGIVDYGEAPAEVLARKSELGSYVHSAVHALNTPDQGELDWGDVPEKALGYVMAYEKFVAETCFKPLHCEYRNAVVLPQGPVGFQVDAFGSMQGLPIVIEVKCTVQEEKSWRIQLAGYVECLLALGFKPEGAPIWNRCALQLKPDGTYKLFPYDQARDKAIWQQALCLATWKENNGYNLSKKI